MIFDIDVPEREDRIILWHGNCFVPQTSVTSENLESWAKAVAADRSSPREGVLLTASNSFLTSADV